MVPNPRDWHRGLERLYRDAVAASDSAYRAWEEARTELQTAQNGLARATQGLPPGNIYPNARGAAVRVVEKQVRTPVERMGVRVVDTSFVQEEVRVPELDEFTLRVHEAKREHNRCRDAFQVAGDTGH
jgi:hypothetical protein